MHSAWQLEGGWERVETMGCKHWGRWLSGVAVRGQYVTPVRIKTRNAGKKDATWTTNVKVLSWGMLVAVKEQLNKP